MNTKNIEEIVNGLIKLEEKAGDYSSEALIINSPRAEQYLRNTLTTLTQHHEAEVEAVEAEYLADIKEILNATYAVFGEENPNKKPPETRQEKRIDELENVIRRIDGVLYPKYYNKIHGESIPEAPTKTNNQTEV